MLVNVVGCGLIGVLMVMVNEVWTDRRLPRPFLGTGVLGGLTMFWTYAVDVQRLLAGGHAGVDRAVQARHATGPPWGTFTVNVAGSLVLGLLTGAASAGAASPAVQLALGTGFCGALTTYSTFSYETLRRIEGGNKLLGLANVVGSIVAGLAAAAAGFALGSVMWS
jgi:CrcB protein